MNSLTCIITGLVIFNLACSALPGSRAPAIYEYIGILLSKFMPSFAMRLRLALNTWSTFGVMSSTSSPLASSARSYHTFRTRLASLKVGILSGVLMPSCTMRRCCLLSASCVFSIGNRLYVVWVHAIPNAAEMVKRKIVRDWSFGQLVCGAVNSCRESLFRKASYSTIAIFIDTSIPYPTVSFNWTIRRGWLLDVSPYAKHQIPCSSCPTTTRSTEARVRAIESTQVLELVYRSGDVGIAALAFVKLLFSHFASTLGDLVKGRRGVQPPRGPFKLLYPIQEAA
jgi:hypothetical protein